MPWFTVDCGLPKHPKMAALPSDAARWGWMVVIAEAKLQARPGTFSNERHFRICVGSYARFLPDYLSARLMERTQDALLVHDWATYQRDPAGRQALHRMDAGHESVTEKSPPSHTLARATRAVPVVVDVSVTDPQSDGGQGEGLAPIVGWMNGKGVYLPGNVASGLTRKVNEMVEAHGPERTIAALDQAWSAGNRDLRSLVFAAWPVLYPVRQVDPKAIAAQEAEERDRKRSARAVANTKRTIHEMGAHAAEPDPACPLCQP